MHIFAGMATMSQSPVEHAAKVLRMFEIEPAPLDRLLGSYLKKRRDLNSRQRRLTAKAVYGWARWRRRLEGVLSQAGVRKPTFKQLAELYLRNHPCEDLEREGGSIAFDPALDGVDMNSASPERFPGGRAAFCSYPDFLYGMLEGDYGAQGAVELALALNEPLGPTLRVNTLKASRDEAVALLDAGGVHARPTEFSQFGLRLSIRADLRASRAFKEGLVELQDEGSQLAALASGAREGMRVLDACAGAGGKALAMAQLMGDGGEIVACDVDAAKLGELKRRAQRAGVRSIRTADADDVLREGGSFEIVFIDAPCSGTGTLRRAPDIKWRVSEEAIEDHAKSQRSLLRDYSRLVKPGGSLVYATCSVLRLENEDVVRDFVGANGFSIQSVEENLKGAGALCDGLITEEGFLRTDPRLGDWDGMFAACIVRT